MCRCKHETKPQRICPYSGMRHCPNSLERKKRLQNKALLGPYSDAFSWLNIFWGPTPLSNKFKLFMRITKFGKSRTTKVQGLVKGLLVHWKTCSLPVSIKFSFSACKGKTISKQGLIEALVWSVSGLNTWKCLEGGALFSSLEWHFGGQKGHLILRHTHVLRAHTFCKQTKLWQRQNHYKSRASLCLMTVQPLTAPNPK